MTLVQIDLRRGRDPRPTQAEPVSAAPTPPAPQTGAALDSSPRARDATASSAVRPGLVLAVGLIVLVPLAAPAAHSAPTLALLLVGLAVLGLIAALLRSSAEVEPP